MNSYELSKVWFDFAFENPEKINPNHAAIFFFAIEHCNRLGWKEKFGFPTQMAMDALGIKKHQTYIKYFNELVEWGFFKLIQKSSNQYSANIISLTNALPKKGKALAKAITTHAAKQTEPKGQSTGQSNSSIIKPDNLEPNNLELDNDFNSKIIEEVLNSQKWIEETAMHLKQSLQYVEEKLKTFLTELKLKDGLAKGVSEVRSHFINWIKIEIEKEKIPQKNLTNGTGKQSNLDAIRGF